MQFIVKGESVTRHYRSDRERKREHRLMLTPWFKRLLYFLPEKNGYGGTFIVVHVYFAKYRELEIAEDFAIDSVAELLPFSFIVSTH